MLDLFVIGGTVIVLIAAVIALFIFADDPR